jgi:ornithine cyclodeaminase/alanine dehydrogenase-like protein (mu-crystallin family)
MTLAPTLSETQIRDLIGPREALAAVRDGFARLARGEATLPDVIGFEVGVGHGEVHVKSAYLHGTPFYSIKVATGFGENAARGIAVNGGLVMVFDARTGHVRTVLLDNGYLTQLRTGAAGGLAAQLLSRPDAQRVGIIGSGMQARYQLEALCLVRKIRDVVVYGRSGARAAEYAADMAQRFGLAARVAGSIREAVEGADIVVTTTSAREPIVRPEWIVPGMHVTAMGSDGFGKRELDVGVLAKADKIVVDHRGQCLSSGEMQQAAAAGLGPDRIHAELGEIAAGLKPGRTSEREITVADLTGVGVQDAAVANEVVMKAIGRGLLPS